jgi:cytochrome bd ubiquinol oxidase subunit II
MLAEIPAVFILLGLVAYTVLAGADFGAGFWTLVAGPACAGRAAARAHARHSMGPVWEANHVWLIFILVVCWTAYPIAFASITSTLAAPLLLAVIGIILRGTSYAIRDQLDTAGGVSAVENVFALSSMLTPFALGTIVGALVTGRVPIGNAQGNMVTSWLNPTSVLLGALAVGTSAYLAAVYLAADAHRAGLRGLELDFRTRALRSGVAVGAAALASLLVVKRDAGPFGTRLTEAGGLAMVVVSAIAGLGTLALVRAGRFEPARASAALAVAAIIAGWAVAQQPWFLPGLTISQAAADHATLIALVLAVGIGAVVLVPSVLLLFVLHLSGRFDPGPVPEALPRTTSRGRKGQARTQRPPRPFAVGASIAGLGLGAALLVLTDSGLVHAVALACLAVAGVSTFMQAATVPPEG